MSTAQAHRTTQTHDTSNHTEQDELSMTAVVQDRYGTAEVLGIGRTRGKIAITIDDVEQR
jgi:hypothetical protein